MLAIERKNLILAKLQKENKVVVSELSQMFDVSEETIRRDLEKLDKEGLAIKTYGGAVLNENNNTELPFTVRENTNVSQKQKIAEIVAGLIKDDSTIMLDASSTALFVARNIKHKKNITLITNSIEILVELADVSGWNILSTGGTVKEGSLALVGHQAEKMLSSYHVDIAIVSSKGIDSIEGFSDSSETHSEIKKKMLDCAFKKILVVDTSKFDRISFKKIGEISDLTTIVTDCEPSDRWKKVFDSAKVEYLYPGKQE
ncbi:DeoR/GlpR family DNA-binding transcription regulator [Lachnoclostridium sp.]|nr:DeoR/GlpR family DNA-binding transcription regulator [Lachnoclostridium sp.]